MVLYCIQVYLMVIKLFHSNKIKCILFILFLQEDIFQQPGLRSEFADIRDCLDTGMADSLCILF